MNQYGILRPISGHAENGEFQFANTENCMPTPRMIGMACPLARQAASRSAMEGRRRLRPLHRPKATAKRQIHPICLPGFQQPPAPAQMKSSSITSNHYASSFYMIIQIWNHTFEFKSIY
jgi:hypothetical protein